MAPHRAASRRGAAALLACALLLGCGGRGGGAGAEVRGSAPAAAGGRDRHEGRYEGHRLPADIAANTACRGRPRPVRFEVENGIIEMRTEGRAGGARRRAGLWGAVSTDGQVAMRPASGKRTVVGRIESDRLSAMDTQDTQAIAQAAAQGGKMPCLYRYEATRVGPPR